MTQLTTLLGKVRQLLGVRCGTTVDTADFAVQMTNLAVPPDVKLWTADWAPGADTRMDIASVRVRMGIRLTTGELILI